MLSENELERILSHIQPARVRMQKITIQRGEGLAEECRIAHTCNTWQESSELLKRMALTCYKTCSDKTDFTIFFEDGEEYKGTYSLRYKDRWFSNHLGRHIQLFLRWYTGEFKPEHLTEKQYAEAQGRIDEETKKNCALYLENYEIGDGSPLVDIEPEALEAPQPAEEVKPNPFADYPAVEDRDRNAVMLRIKAGLEKRSGKRWSVTGGKGTGWGWLKINVPPSERVWNWEGTSKEGYCNYMSEERRVELASLLGIERAHNQGVQVMPNAWIEFIDRAEGRKPRQFGHRDWD